MLERLPYVVCIEDVAPDSAFPAVHVKFKVCPERARIEDYRSSIVDVACGVTVIEILAD